MAQPSTFGFEAIEQAARPYEFSGEESEPQGDRDQPRTRRHEHHYRKDYKRTADEGFWRSVWLVRWSLGPRHKSLGPRHKQYQAQLLRNRHPP
jgi:hypothetical protein